MPAHTDQTENEARPLMAKRKWADLTIGERQAVVGLGAAQLLFLGAALRDLRRRPAHKIRGSKRLWTPIVFINFIGPIAYFLLGRRR